MRVDPKAQPLFIYNIFPSLVGEVNKWFAHVERASDMGFNWIFLNPIHLTGASGSLYAIRDHFRLSPVFFPSEDPQKQWDDLAAFVRRCRQRGIDVMVDLVLNHTAYDNPLTRDHRDWYKKNPDGTLKNPGAVDDQAPGGYVVWGDLSEIDNENSPDRHNLYEYWWRVVDMFLGVGVRGFRCDSAYQVPMDLWRLLISRAKSKEAAAIFCGESLGCPMEKTLALAQAGFDYVFNSGKWWDFRQEWFLEQMNMMAGKARTICFPESHDTRRLAEEYGGDARRVKQRYLFSALISSGVMILIGFEYGFRKKPHVVRCNPYDWEGAHFDITDFIREVNALKRQHRLLCEDNRLERVESSNHEILALRKTSLDGSESALILFNLSDRRQEMPLTPIWQRFNFRPLPSGAQAAMACLRPWGAAVIKLAK